ncbi:MAG: hypothetical protein KIT76_11305 [Pseudolabrys sp.]|nr:hypothetical protein [Pseudolabrys sp.]
MSLKTVGLGIVASLLCGTLVTPASAEFFGCKEPHTKVTYTSSSSRQAFTRYSAGHGHYASAPRRAHHAGLFAPFQRSSGQRW